MYLATVNAILHEIENPALSLSARALLRCRLARQQEQAGDYEAASEAMADLWQGVGARPMLEGLDDETAAQVSRRPRDEAVASVRRIATERLGT